MGPYAEDDAHEDEMPQGIVIVSWVVVVVVVVLIASLLTMSIIYYHCFFGPSKQDSQETDRQFPQLLTLSLGLGQSSDEDGGWDSSSATQGAIYKTPDLFPPHGDLVYTLLTVYT